MTTSTIPWAPIPGPKLKEPMPERKVLRYGGARYVGTPDLIRMVAGDLDVRYGGKFQRLLNRRSRAERSDWIEEPYDEISGS